MSPGISHIIYQSSGESHLNSLYSISDTLYWKPQGSEGGGRGAVENDTASTNSHSGGSSIGKNTNSCGTPSRIHQKACKPIIDAPISTVRNETIIQANYKYYIVQEIAAKEQIWEYFQNHELTFGPNLFEDIREYVDYLEFTVQKIKAAVIATKKVCDVSAKSTKLYRSNIIIIIIIIIR